ncbi:MAG: hypothetical protein IJM44_01250 [Ruminococcus sp.]|nr:hypothetical protein [Ruminococcus sp.]
MDRIWYYIISGAAAFIAAWVKYFIDANREKKGLPSKYRPYMDNGDNPMQFVNFYTPDGSETVTHSDGSTETVIVHENDASRREKYNFSDRSAAMDTIESVGTMPPKEGSDRE